MTESLLNSSSRFTELKYTVSFSTPAFLGNAEQKGQWRTPPFKALLRQWWRVVYAADKNFLVNISDMRREEGMLFGHAWLEDDHDDQGRKVSARKSLVRIRLDVTKGDSTTAWELGTQRGVAPLQTDLSTSYAWFGLVRRGNSLPDRTGILADKAEGQRILRIRCPIKHEQQIVQTMRLIHAFGQLGSRSRVGWGSIQISNVDPLQAAELNRFAKPCNQCLTEDWGRAFGKDEKIWVWESDEFSKPWNEVMKTVAIERRRIRTTLKTVNGRDLRAILGFAGNGRMPSPLRWKLIETKSGRLKIRAFALPHNLPADSGKQLTAALLIDAWKAVCVALDASDIVKRGMA